ncbi:hypothetical protein V5799_003718 [Amblyomma americanum]|uniref:Uncharacterized protein n=1 Tax=Amblyomma americanum TaxID=6943 RepID=A0AAQ4D860_AMBAM
MGDTTNQYLEEESLYHSEFRTELRTLSTKNIRHFGILNVIANADVLAGMVTRLKKITARLKVLQYHDRSRFLAVAIGLSKHNEGFAWDRYRQYLKTLSSYPLDILVAISSVGGIAGERECFAIPPTIWSSANGTSPSLNIPGQVAAYNDDLRIHQGNNTFTVSTLDKTRARTYAALKSLSVGEEKYEMNAYETDEEIYAEFQKRNRNLNLVGGRQLGKSRHVSPDSRDAAAERDLIPGM